MQKRHTATSDEETAGYAYIHININKFVELYRVNAWCDGVPWKKFTIGLQDEQGQDQGMEDGYSLQRHALRWEAKTRLLEFIERIEVTVQDPVAAEIYQVRVTYQPIDSRMRGHA